MSRIDDPREDDDGPERRAREQLEQLRILSCDLAEHHVERLGSAQGFAVWHVDGDVQSFTERAQDIFDRVSARIERALLFWRDHGRDDAVVTEALAELADAAVVARVLRRL